LRSFAEATTDTESADLRELEQDHDADHHHDDEHRGAGGRRGREVDVVVVDVDLVADRVDGRGRRSGAPSRSRPITSTKMKMNPIITPGSESGRMTSRKHLERRGAEILGRLDGTRVDRRQLEEDGASP